MLDGFFLTQINAQPLGRRGLGHPAIVALALLLAIDCTGTVLVVVVLAGLGGLLECEVGCLGSRLIRRLCLLVGIYLELVNGDRIPIDGIAIRVIAREAGDQKPNIARRRRIEIDDARLVLGALGRRIDVLPSPLGRVVILCIFGLRDLDLESRGLAGLPVDLCGRDLLVLAQINVNPMLAMAGVNRTTPTRRLRSRVAIGRVLRLNRIGLLAVGNGVFVQRQVAFGGVHLLRSQEHRRGTQRRKAPRDDSSPA